MKNKFYKNWWLWVLIILLLIGTFFILDFDKKVTEKYIQNEINEANYCESDSDCGLVTNSKCPFGCYIYVNKNEVDKIDNLLKDYESQCIYGCVKNQGVECINNKCEEVLLTQ